MDSRASETATRRRLLEAAGQTIAAKGYHAASVREICQRAGANVAAVNYHFGSKERLHEAVLNHVMGQAMARHPLDLDRLAGMPPPERLRGFVSNFLLMHLEFGQPGWHHEIMAREIVRPSKALHSVMQKVARHNMAFLDGLVREVLGPQAPAASVELCVASVIGQCTYYPLVQKLVPRIFRHIDLSPAGIERIAEHLADFSLAAMTALRRRPGSAGRKGRGRGRG